MQDAQRGMPVTPVEVTADTTSLFMPDGRPIIPVKAATYAAPPADGRPVRPWSRVLRDGAAIVAICITASAGLFMPDGRPILAGMEVGADGLPVGVTAKLAPASGWNGTEGTGFTAAEPTDPVRVGAKAVAQSWIVPNQRFTADFPIVVGADAKGGIDRVTFNVEGTTTDVTAPTWWDVADGNGGTKKVWGYGILLDWAAASAKSATGFMRVYATAVPTNGAIQSTVIGPLRFCNAATAYSITKTVGTGGDYASLKAACDAWKTNIATWGVHPEIRVITSGDYQFAGLNVTHSNATGWVTFTTAGGVTAGLTSGGTRTTIRSFLDGQRFKGTGWQFDLSKFSLIFLESTNGVDPAPSNLSQFWCDGIGVMQTGGRNAVYDGMQPDQFWLAPSSGGQPIRTYFTDCTMNDVYWCVVNAALARGNTGSCADDFMQNVTASQGNICTDLDPAQVNGLRYHVPAITVTYTGGGTSATIEASAAPGNARVMTLFKNGAQVGTTLNVTHPGYAPGGSGYTTWADIAAWINTQGGAAGFAATVTGNAGTRRGSSVSKAGLQATAMTGGNALNVFGGSGTLTSWFDIHGDVLQLFGNHTNRFHEMVSAKSVNSAEGCQGLFLDYFSSSFKDCALRNFEIATKGSPIAVSQIHSACSHVLVRRCSLYDQQMILRADLAAGSKFDPDAYCEVSYNAFNTFSWNGTPDADIVLANNNVASGGLPSGSVSSTTVAASLYVGAPANLSAGAGMPAGVGARLADGSWNVA